MQDAGVRELVAKTRRGVAPVKKAALTLQPLQAMLATRDDSLRGTRDRALLLFAWASGGRRGSEMTAATTKNTVRTGPSAFAYQLRRAAPAMATFWLPSHPPAARWPFSLHGVGEWLLRLLAAR